MTRKPKAKPPAAAHTPLPWQWDEDSPNSRIYITPTDRLCHYVADINSPETDPDGDYPTRKQRLANAELIVRAVNAHDELVGALGQLLKKAEAYIPYRADGWNDDDRENYEIIDRAKAALRKAQGGVRYES